ncbi:hypothetical protein HanPSC8_Chr10g0417431 [Helianthus annuus]|nr:hypothetical protein HanPSC8_Chr10g0417431 [Helianthus annuus]
MFFARNSRLEDTRANVLQKSSLTIRKDIWRILAAMTSPGEF